MRLLAGPTSRTADRFNQHTKREGTKRMKRFAITAVVFLFLRGSGIRDLYEDGCQVQEFNDGIGTRMVRVLGYCDPLKEKRCSDIDTAQVERPGFRCGRLLAIYYPDAVQSWRVR